MPALAVSAGGTVRAPPTSQTAQGTWLWTQRSEGSEPALSSAFTSCAGYKTRSRRSQHTPPPSLVTHPFVSTDHPSMETVYSQESSGTLHVYFSPCPPT